MYPPAKEKLIKHSVHKKLFILFSKIVSTINDRQHAIAAKEINNHVQLH